MRACVRACVRAYVRACVRACVPTRQPVSLFLTHSINDPVTHSLSPSPNLSLSHYLRLVLIIISIISHFSANRLFKKMMCNTMLLTIVQLLLPPLVLPPPVIVVAALMQTHPPCGSTVGRCVQQFGSV